MSTLNVDDINLGGRTNNFRGVDIASAATVDLSSATGDLVHITGTVSINIRWCFSFNKRSKPLPSGRSRHNNSRRRQCSIYCRRRIILEMYFLFVKLST